MSTISHEIAQDKGVRRYRAVDANDRSWRRAKRPKAMFAGHTPAASAGTSFQTPAGTPLFHGMICGTTPSDQHPSARLTKAEGNISAQTAVEAAEPSTYHQRWLRERPEGYGDDVRTLLEAGELLPATHYLQAQRYRALLRTQALAALEKTDVLVCPTLPFTATPLDETTVAIEPGAPRTCSQRPSLVKRTRAAGFADCRDGGI